MFVCGDAYRNIYMCACNVSRTVRKKSESETFRVACKTRIYAIIFGPDSILLAEMTVDHGSFVEEIGRTREI